MADKASDIKVRQEDAARLLKLRTQLGLSQRAVATAAGISQSLYNELERGKHKFLARHFDSLEKALGASVRRD